MNIQFPFTITVQFPGDLEYIPSVRKFVSEIVQVSNFSPKFAYRSEIIVDEICNNAVNYGCATNDAMVELTCEVNKESVEFLVKDEGGNRDHLKRLRHAMKAKEEKGDDRQRGLGLEIVKMLSEKLDLQIDSKNLTSIHVVRKREEAEKQPSNRQDTDHFIDYFGKTEMATKTANLTIKSTPISPEIAILEAKGHLYSESIREISGCFDTILERNLKFVILDMVAIDSISSAAIGELMGGRKSMIEAGGDLVLAGMNLNLRTKLNLMGANKIFRFFSDLRTAINAYKWEFQHKAETINLAFPPNLKFVPPVRQFASRIARQKGYGNRDSFRIETIVDEVCNNAVEHGVKGSDQKVSMSIRIDIDKVELDVMNMSDPEKIASLKTLMEPGPGAVGDAQPGTDERRGRGLALIRMLSNNLTVNFRVKGPVCMLQK